MVKGSDQFYDFYGRNHHTFTTVKKFQYSKTKILFSLNFGKFAILLFYRFKTEKPPYSSIKLLTGSLKGIGKQTTSVSVSSGILVYIYM